MGLYNIKATISLDVNDYEDVGMQEALADLKKDLETRFPPAYVNLVVTTSQQ